MRGGGGGGLSEACKLRKGGSRGRRTTLSWASQLPTAGGGGREAKADKTRASERKRERKGQARKRPDRFQASRRCCCRRCCSLLGIKTKTKYDDR